MPAGSESELSLARELLKPKAAAKRIGLVRRPTIALLALAQLPNSERWWHCSSGASAKHHLQHTFTKGATVSFVVFELSTS